MSDPVAGGDANGTASAAPAAAPSVAVAPAASSSIPTPVPSASTSAYPTQPSAAANPYLYVQQQNMYGPTSALLGMTSQQPAATAAGYTGPYGGIAGYGQYGYPSYPSSLNVGSVPAAGVAAGGIAPKPAGVGGPNKPKKRKRKKQYSDEESEDDEEEEEEIFEPEPEPILEPSENWIQCEDAACQKWRRIPRDYDTTKFKTFEEMQQSSWFCHMNPDESRNQCSIPEEPFDETQEIIIPPKKVKKPRGPRKPKVPKPEPEPEPEPEDDEEDAGEKDDDRDEDYNGESDPPESDGSGGESPSGDSVE